MYSETDVVVLFAQSFSSGLPRPTGSRGPSHHAAVSREVSRESPMGRAWKSDLWPAGAILGANAHAVAAPIHAVFGAIASSERPTKQESRGPSMDMCSSLRHLFVPHSGDDEIMYAPSHVQQLCLG